MTNVIRKNAYHNHHHNMVSSSFFPKRLLLVVAMIIGCLPALRAQTNAYVFYNSTYGYLFNDNGTLTAGDLQFDSTSVWIASGSIGNSSRTIRTYKDSPSIYLGAAGSLTTTSSNWRGSNNYLCYRPGNTNYYLKATSATTFTTNSSQNSGERFYYYTVTISGVSEPVLTDFTINSGQAIITTIDDYSYGHSNANYTPAYTNYRFSNTNHYVGVNNNTLTNVNPTSVTSGYTWALSDNASGYATLEGNVLHVTALPTSDHTITLTCTLTYEGITKMATKEIVLQSSIPSAPIISVSGTTVTMSTTAAGTTTIRYTLDGTDPTATTGTEYSGAIDLSGSTTSPVTIKAITVRNGNASAVSEEIVTLTLPTPVITVNGSAGTATIACDITGTTIYYTTNGSEPTTSSTPYTTGLSGLSPMTTIKAIAVKSGWNNSPVATETVTIPSGVSGGTVTLFDYEDHNWTYYSGVDTSVDGGNYNTNYAGKLYSPNPRNVKITYNGVNGISGSSTSVQVSISESENKFVYYKTLEQGSTSGEYPYQVISNPFSVRPSTGTGNNKVYYGFAGWKIVSGYQYIRKANGDMAAQNAVLGLDEEITFVNLPYPSVNCTSAEIVFETTWKTANRTYVSTNPGSDQTYNTSGDYESNFYVINCNYTRTITTSGPVTIMMVEPDGSSDYRNNYTFTGNITPNITPNNNGVTKIEWAKWNSTNTVNANFKNLWIGRGMTTTSQCATLITGLNTTNQTAGTKFSIKVESGKYDYFDFYKGHSTYTGGTANTTATITGTSANAIITIGNDYDRAKASTNNQNLEFKYGPMFGYQSGFNSRNNRDNKHTLDLTVKSGRIGYTFFMENTNTANYLQGGAGYCMYLSSAGAQTNVGTRNVLIEGGDICTIGSGVDSYNNAPSNNDTPSTTTNYNRLAFNVRIKGGTIHGNVYGGAAKSPSGGNRVMVMTGGQVMGWFAAGCNGTDNDGGQNYGTSWVYIGGNAKVDSEGSTKVLGYANGGNVYAAGAGRQGATTCGEMTFGTNLVIADDSYIERGIYGGGNYGYALASTNIYITGGTNEGKDGTVNNVTTKGGVFGGANQQNGPGINMYMTGGKMKGGVYGGCNTQGTISNSVTMQINGGQVGTSSATANIHGGGYGNQTRVSQNVDITLGTTGQTEPGVTIYGDVYGGSALGYVNGTAATNTYHTNVTMNKGIINGSLYGGGLGDANTAANVYGPVAVKVYGGSVNKTDANGANGSGGVYGANNVNGAPQRSVTVDIYGTDPAPSTDEYALYAVYGGGNQADYTYGNGYPQVTVHNCDNSIEYVYGGGNAAAVASTDVTIYGGNVIGNVFGGGNGTVTAANVTGNTLTKIYGGTILKVFGGSNSQGTIGGTITVNAESQTESGTNPLTGTAFERCPIQVGELYGGGNMAASNVGAISIGCMNAGDMIDYVYGGSNDADITGNVNLTMTGGRVGNLFGGNNTGHSISGSITVTVNWDGSCNNNYLGNVFGGGNLATFGTTQSPKAPTVNIYNGTVSGNVYGGGKGLESDHTKGQVSGNPIVTIGDNVNGHTAVVVGDVYGGGDAGNVEGTPQVNVINKCNTSIGNVYGGGNAADVSGTDVNIDGGNITGMVFGGGHGDKNSTPQKEANVNGDVAVTVTGGTISKVFGGSNSKGNITGDVEVVIEKGANSCDMHITEVYGGGNEAAGNAGTITIGCTGDYTNNGEGIGDVYGGANAADINNNISLTIRGGHIDRVFGGNNASGNISGTIAVEVNWDNALTCDKYLGNVFGGGNHAAYAGSPTVTLTNGIVSHNVYGGGNEAGVGGSTVNINGGQVVEGVYGGCNTSGTVTGDIAVNLTAGTIGATNGTTDIVFGGGYGDQTATQGNVTVTVNGSTIHGNVYGGSALGQVNNESTDLTTVDVLGGTVNGNIYGGGLGQAGDGNVTKGQVNGTVTVNIGATDGAQNPTYSGNATINGSVYGCNNTNGSPKADVTVNVYQTAHITTNAATYTGNDATYAIDQVFGGGNQADYTPTSTQSRATVHVYTCDNTIRRVFGGGNAAAAYGVVTTIDGGRFDYIFGGGNGEDIAANIGAGGTNLTVNSGVINYLFGGSNEQGTINGPMLVAVNNNTGCTEDIKKFFAGGNLAVIGTQEHPVNLETTIACGTVFDEVYGGSNLADIYGNVTLTINGGTIGTVYAGSKGRSATSDPSNSTPKAANIYGTTELNIHAGDIGNAFGGSNINGNITGSITVNMDWSQSNCSEKSINNVFGASNLATYTPTTPGGYPAVNIKHGTVTKSVYGGGKGASAVVTSNPVVTIGDANADHYAVVTENVFGGGDAAAVTGNTSVTYNDNNASSTVANLFGGGNNIASGGVSGTASVTLTSGKVTAGVYGGCNTSGTVNGAINVYVNGGTIGSSTTHADGVFGGGFGESTATGDNVTVTIGNADATTPQIYGDIYGGSAKGKVNSSSASPLNTTKVWLKKGTITGDIYGGGYGLDNAEALVYGNVQVIIDGGTVNSYITSGTNTSGGRIFGCNNVNGTPKGTVEVTVNATNASSGSGNSKVYALQGVYGGGNLAGYVPTATSADYPIVTVNGCASSIKDVYGGGNAAPVPNTKVVINGGDINRVFAGGNGESGTPAHIGWNNTDTSPTTDDYGTGIAYAEINGGTILQVYGGSNANGVIRTSSSVKVDKSTAEGACGMIIGEVYGGGNQAAGNAGAITIGCTGGWTNNHNSHNDTDNRIGYELEGIGTVYGGANQADINNGITLNINSGIVENVFGGNNTSGAISGDIEVNIEKTNDGCGWYVGNVYGGGNHADYSGTPEVNIIAGTVSGNVYGGGNDITTANAGVAGSNVEMTGGTVLGGIYGGCNLKGTVTGNSLVKIYGGTVGSNDQLSATTPVVAQVFGGGLGENTNVTGGVTVTISRASGEGAPAAPIIYGDVYGGSALGSVNTTTVNILDGTLKSNPETHNIPGSTLTYTVYHGGNVYGGGLGRANVYDGNGNITTDNSAMGQVNGEVTVNIGAPAGDVANTTAHNGNATIEGNVYGCNNTNGSPQDDVTVNIYATAHTAGVNGVNDNGYALDNVFGGGNEADFTASGKAITVNVYGCDNTIRRTFGGGNAAATKDVTTMIQGGHINEAYGGGNGERGQDYAADVDGDVTLEIHGGTVDHTFAGSNQNGAITGRSEVTIDGTGPCGNPFIDELFMGGNYAEWIGNIEATVTCAQGMQVRSLYGGCKQANVVAGNGQPGNVHLIVEGGTYQYIYGGSQGTSDTPANIDGDVILDIHGGTLTNTIFGDNETPAIFGGSHINGSIGGTIVVTVDDQPGGCDLDVSAANVYGGGNKANYTTPNDNDKQDYPVVNIKNATVLNVFGGGLEADVTGNPRVAIWKYAKVLRNVYGGGNLGEITGNPKVIINGDKAGKLE